LTTNDTTTRGRKKRGRKREEEISRNHAAQRVALAGV
jgi:hypothetical protein